MTYEMAVLAALVQIEHPSRPKISEATGISPQRINTALGYLRDYLDVDIKHRGARKNGFYEIVSWGAFETGKLIRNKALSLNLQLYRDSRKLEHDPQLAKKHYAQSVKIKNYKQSLLLEGFKSTATDKEELSKDERAKKREDILRKYLPRGASLA